MNSFYYESKFEIKKMFLFFFLFCFFLWGEGVGGEGGLE